MRWLTEHELRNCHERAACPRCAATIGQPCWLVQSRAGKWDGSRRLPNHDFYLTTWDSRGAQVRVERRAEDGGLYPHRARWLLVADMPPP